MNWRQQTRRWAWIWIPLAFFVTVMGWGLASPVGAAPDDDYHLASIWCGLGERAGSCSDPHVQPPVRLVPASVMNAADCYAFKPEVTAECAKAVMAVATLVPSRHINQVEGLYPGGFYQIMSLFVGPDVERSVLVMRMVNGLLASALLMAVLRLLPAGLASAATIAMVVTCVPLGLSLIASTSPSSWSIMGIGTYWAFLLAYLRRPRATDRRGILIALAAVVSAGLAIASRVDSAAYIAIASLVVLFLADWKVSSRRYWRLALPLALTLVGVATYVVRGQPLTGGEGTLGTTEAGVGLLLTNLAYFPVLVQGVVGGWQLSWNDVLMPPLVPVVGTLALGALAYRGLLNTWRAKLWAAGVALVALVAVPVAYLQAQHLGVGEVVQPRYILPLVTVLAGVLCLGPRIARPLPLPTVPFLILGLGLSASGSLAFWAYIHRFASGSGVGLFDINGAQAWSRVGDVKAMTVIAVISTSVLVFGALNVGREEARP